MKLHQAPLQGQVGAVAFEETAGMARRGQYQEGWQDLTSSGQSSKRPVGPGRRKVTKRGEATSKAQGQRQDAGVRREGIPVFEGQAGSIWLIVSSLAHVSQCDNDLQKNPRQAVAPGWGRLTEFRKGWDCSGTYRESEARSGSEPRSVTCESILEQPAFQLGSLPGPVLGKMT